MRETERLCALLGIEHAIIQAPMAGGATTPELVAAVSNAGALGMLGAAYLSPAEIEAAIAAVRRLTGRPFGVNLFAGGREPAEGADPAPMLGILGRYHAALGLPPPAAPSETGAPFEAQMEVVLAARVPVFSFTFGIPDAGTLRRLRDGGIVVLGTATTVEEARQLAAAGVDAVVTQGSEAGAHRGTFAGPFEAALVGTMALVPQAVDAVDVPVIASGGIMDGRGIVAAQALGAAGVQMGTAFLTCRESGIPDAYKAAVRSARDDQTALTRAFSGRPARGILNEFMSDLQGQEAAILPFPLQNALTRPLRNAAAARGDTRYLSLWAGQAAALARDLGAGELVAQLVREADEVRGRIGLGAGA
jgi:nitronate monooxygenase